MKTLFSIGNFNIPFFGTMIMIGILAALLILKYEARRKNIKTEKILDLALIGLVGGIIGARLGYVVFYNLEYYIQNPLSILKIHQGGLSIHGGLIGGIIFSILYLRKNKELNLFVVADIAAPAIILAQGIGRIGCDVYGKIMVEPKFMGIPVNGVFYHPAQAYEFLLDYLLFLFLWRKRKSIKYDGQLFGLYIIGFALIRSIVELSRNNPEIFGLISISHLLSLLLIIFGIIWMKIASSKFDTENLNNHLVTNNNIQANYRDILIILGLMIVSLIIFYSGQLLL